MENYAFTQFRPYLSIRDSFKTFNFIIKNKLFDRTYNVVSENMTVNDIIKNINKYKKTSIKLVDERIMNQLSYKVNSSKIKKRGLALNSKIKKDIEKTFKLLDKKKKNEKNICKITKKKTKQIIDFGKMPITNGFLKKKNFKKNFFFNLSVHSLKKCLFYN